MELSVSNIAWDDATDVLFYQTVAKAGFKHVDLAPTKFWPDWKRSDSSEKRFIQLIDECGVSPVGMQSLFFGTEGLNIFSSGEAWENCKSHMENVADIAKIFGITQVVFGSPANRDPGSVVASDAWDFAKKQFSELADIFSSRGTTLCIEPVPAAVGGKFLQDTVETGRFVREASHPALKLNLDTGVLCGESRSVAEIVNECADVISHVHASEPGLASFSHVQSDHANVAKALREIDYKGVVAIEMRAESGKELENLETALEFVGQIYGG